MSLPYIPLYTSEFIADTQGLTDEEVGAYTRVLLYSWNDGDKEPVELSRALRLLDNPNEVWPVLSRFFVEENGRIYNNRLEKERKKSRAKVDAGRKGGSKSPSKPPSETGSKPEAEQQAKPQAKPEATQNSELRTQNKDNSEGNKDSVLSLLDEFPTLSFPSMTIPRLLEEQVLKPYGLDALRFLLEKLSKIEDRKKVSAPAYVRKVIEGNVGNFEGIRSGELNADGTAVRSYRYQAAKDYADKHKLEFRRYFAPRLVATGERFHRDEGNKLLYFYYPQGDALKDPVWLKIRENRELISAISSTAKKSLVNAYQIPEAAFMPAEEADLGPNWYWADAKYLEENELLEAVKQAKRGY